MSTIAAVAALVVAVLHAWFFALETFLWTHRIGLATFRRSAEEQASTRVLAANQGVYNAVLAAGLVYAVASPATTGTMREALLLAVVVVGLFGAATAARAILVVQALPGAIALALSVAAGRV